MQSRVILEPRTLAKMLDALDIGPSELVLDVGAALGYSSAVMARMAEMVIGVEEDEALATEAQEALVNAGIDNVIIHQAALTDGAPEHGPFDVIVVQGGVGQLPKALEDQLKDGGRIACLFVKGALGEVRVGRKQNGTVTWRMAFNAGAPVLPGFESASVFQL